jgi:hypothetical protein
MAAALRLVAPFLAALLATSTTVAQPPVAPPPHPPLAEVVAEYKRLGLPFPPPNVEPVQIDDGFGDLPSYRLAYRVPPANPADRPRYLEIGWYGVGFSKVEVLKAGDVREPGPSPDLPQLVDDPHRRRLLALAVQCKERGWDELAEAAYLHARERLVDEESPRSVFGELRDMAFLDRVWALGRGGDGKEALRRLTALVKEEPGLLTPETKDLLRQIGSTFAPRKSKPGSVESLIDGLTGYFTENGNGPFTGWEAPKDPASYWKLAELGFDAVPTLIEHVTDDRLTWSSRSGYQYGSAYGVTVGHLCSQLLFDLSGRTIGGEYSVRIGSRLDPAEAKKWFEQARKVGEEKWLLDRAIPANGGKAILNQVDRPESHIVRVIGAKYPSRLPAIYRAILKSPASPLIGDFVNEVVASKLPLKEKVALLEEGAAHDRPDHRSLALEGLAKLDQAALRKHLLATLKRIEVPVGKAHLDWDIVDAPCDLVASGGDRACWDALLALAKAAGADDRVIFIRQVVPRRLPDPNDPQRRERIRFLLQFLDDRAKVVERYESQPEGSEERPVIEVRDYAASRLASLLDFPVRRIPYSYHPVHDATLGPFARLWLREAVRRAAAPELAAGR